jgi:hypothetical protein
MTENPAFRGSSRREVDAIEPLGRSGKSEALASRRFPWHPNPHSFPDETGEAHDSGEIEGAADCSQPHEPESTVATKSLAVTKASSIACVAVRQ